jgi:hypothetical protein
MNIPITPELEKFVEQGFQEARPELHPGHEIGLRRFQHEIEVVGHEAQKACTWKSVLAQASASVLRKSCRSTSSKKISSRRSPLLMTW